ncbi:hypothetical protein [Streptomyces alkaliterrae]|uniref:Uncharacterized protein n=1 Tax=Streptomyces alkaliterrae TaxID=2213162 RepID=A0A7W3WP08_9ACTN|nr:hypothetical protein [Streptomyces alkaliterrae]MBB1255450.1 hypothetical protein [Streptomyces alkaliterrae]MBB1260644.1 hypothetical protein [Streptomyces alkaliterrae]
MGHGKTASGDLNFAERKGIKRTFEDAFFAQAKTSKKSAKKQKNER